MFKNDLLTFILCISVFAISCKTDDTTIDDPIDPVNPVEETVYFMGVEAATDPATDILTPATSLEEGINLYELVKYN